jgi:PAS domain-containing protein
MKTHRQAEAEHAVFLQTVSVAIARLKQRLQQDYEQANPGLRKIVHLVLDEEETKAWELSLFPHLLFPDLVEAHIAKLNLQPASRLRKARARQGVVVKHEFTEIDDHQSVFALCG